MLTESHLDQLKLDPMAHIEIFQGVTTVLPYQQRVIESIVKNERTVVAAAHDLGKTWLAAKIVLWFTSTFDGAKVITTAPTFNQVKRLLWSEIRDGYARSRFPLGGEMLMTEWKIKEDWFAVGFTSRNEAGGGGEGQGMASGFQGFHAPAILVIFDEATGIAPGIWKQLEGIMTSHFVRFLAIGNPTSRSCEFFQCFSNPVYKKMHLSCFDSPNFEINQLHTLADLTAEYLTVKELSQEEQSIRLESYKIANTSLLTVRWVMQMILKWGLTHPLVVSKCFGKFPEEDQNTLITLGTVQESQLRRIELKGSERISIGVDVARYGNDKTVITVLQGLQQVKRKVLVKRDSNEISGELIRIIKGFMMTKDIHIAIDSTGIGSGVVDSLKESRNQKVIGQNVEIRECHFGAGPGGFSGPQSEIDLKSKYVNLKARIFIELADDLKTDLCLIEDDIYLEELPTIQYKFDSKGRWQIESKEEYQKRTGRSSPDDSDSLALANYARYDASNSGNFSSNLLQKQKGSIIGSRGQKLW